ncbi:MAG: hypothetical protein UX77_C0001G0019 [Parcubacteria group bacterium GW2011_GWA1_47_11]|nr:MAG: hypothetical protein UX29_C0014G0024 [Parcubacteria group bacterium GW2011_GWA2_46_10]KKU56346.1 MAG: hypothetical protein UX77_C0001G0019 [Parcubacteria group bacterium GW2011_GWA1_47_11]
MLDRGTFLQSMTKPKIILVLPALNLAKELKETLDKVKRTVSKFSNRFCFRIYVISDGSTDNTHLIMKKWQSECGLDVEVLKNNKNRGLVETLKDTYKKVLRSEEDAHYVLKTDLDKDYDQEAAISKLLGCIPQGNLSNPSFDMVVGSRTYKKQELKRMKACNKTNHEFERREKILKIMKKHFTPDDFDPSSVGSQLYKMASLRRVLQNKSVGLFLTWKERYGLDVVIPLAALFMKMRFKKISVGSGKYVAKKSDVAKKRYDTYERIINLFISRSEGSSSRARLLRTRRVTSVS